MKIHLIDTTNQREVNRFVDFPFKLYQDHPYYVPMLKAGQRKLLDKTQHPFFKHSEADFFIVEEGDQVLARICVMENTAYNSYQKEKAAFIGYFDVAENIEAARMIFRQVDEWASARGLDTIYRPQGTAGCIRRRCPRGRL